MAPINGFAMGISEEQRCHLPASPRLTIADSPAPDFTVNAVESA